MTQLVHRGVFIKIKMCDAKTTSIWLFSLLLLLLLSADSAVRADQRDAPQKPSIVFILADDMGWSAVKCFGSDLHQTPNIDRLAAAGMKFTDAYAAAHICSPTRASIMTGKYPARLHLTDYIAGNGRGKLRPPKWTKQLPLEEVTIAEALKAAGYATGHFGKWHLNKNKGYRPGRPGDPGSQGFDDVLTTHKPRRSADPKSDAHHVKQITDRAVAFMEKNKQRPFFCYVTHNTLHRPEMAHPDLVKRYKQQIKPGMSQTNAIYAAMVHDLDESVGRIVAKVDELGIADRTLVIFTSDNGGFLGDGSDSGTTNAPLRSGKGHIFEGGIRAPTIVHWPGVTKKGSVCGVPISSVDFYPTLLEITGAKGDAAHNADVDGISLVGLLKDSAAKLPREAIYWHYPHYSPQGGLPAGAVRSGRFKLIEFFEDMHVELYDLAADLGEKTDLAEKMPAKTDSLRKQLHAWRQAVGAQMPIRKR